MTDRAVAAARDFDRLRPRLQGIAYRMLGSMAEAEEVVQDAWLRWHGTAPGAIEHLEAWLVTVTTRLAIDRYRAGQARREHYVGFWLPEPVLTDEAGGDLLGTALGGGIDGEAPATPEQLLERADEVSVAFLMVLERLAPEARAAFLLREVFDVDYADVARILDKSEAACRQLVHRARAQLRDERPRYRVPDDTHRRLLQGFADAAASGDFAALQALLDDGAELISDGGGKVPSFGQVLQGGRRIAQLYFAAARRHGAGGVRLRVVRLNGRWALLRWIDGALESAVAVETDGARIARLHVQRNPDKLARLAAACPP